MMCLLSPLKIKYRVAVASMLLSASMSGWAQQNDDTLKLNAAYSLMTDSNLFRLPANTNFMAQLGRSSAEEKVSITSVGFAVNKAYSLQRFEFDASVVNYGYQNFNTLSFVATNYDAAWRWSLTPRLTGNLTSKRNETQNSFTDSSFLNQRNLRIDTTTRLDAVYDLGGAWRLLGGVWQSGQANQQQQVAQSDFTAFTTEAGLRYALQTGSSLTYTFKNARGKYTNRALNPTAFIDDGYSQFDNEVKAHWVLNGHLTSDIRLDQINRKHPNISQRDFSGLNSSADITWSISGKSALTAGWARSLSSYQTSTSNYQQTDRLSIGPVWQISPKATARLSYAAASIDYLGSPTGAPGVPRSDNTRDISLSMDWQPHPKLTVGASLQNATRTSTFANLDYDSNMLTLTAQIAY
jgi:exopolysaccharide biosynthesis operon protein EpsL